MIPMFTFSRHEEVLKLAKIIELTLGESPGESMKLSWAWYKRKMAVIDYWKSSVTDPIEKSLQKAELFQMKDEELLQNFASYHNGGIVLLTIHLGDYLHMLLRLVRDMKPRNIVTIRRHWTVEDKIRFGKAEHFGHKIIPLINDAQSARTIVKELRKGALAILLFDLPERWGSSAPVRIFSQDFSWVKGPIELALLGKASLIPVFTFQQNEQWYCDLHAVRSYEAVGHFDQDYCRSELQQCAEIAQYYIRNNVTQWENWHLVPEMFAANSHVRTNFPTLDSSPDEYKDRH
jgi:lauroyl/myristoyl acyltransferase